MQNKRYPASIKNIKKYGFSMPFTSPSALKIDYVFKNREYLVITYESDIDILREVVPEPLIVTEPLVKFQFLKMPDAYGFGNYSLVGQMIDVEYKGITGSYAHAMYLDNLAPIAAGREIWGFPEKLGNPNLIVDVDTILGTLKYNSTDIAIGTMGYKHHSLDHKKIKKSLEKTPNFLLKIIPDVNLKQACVCQLVRYYLKDIKVSGAWSGPASLQLFKHALAPVANLPVKKIISGEHIIADLTLGYGEILYDYLD